jgi:uncharacterized protein (DUF2267 family)
MPMGHPYDIEHAQRLHEDWCRQLQQRAGLRTADQAERQMIAVMHELRRTLAPRTIVSVANALPALERGIFLGGWSLHEVPCGREVPPGLSIAADVGWVWLHNLDARRADVIRGVLPPAFSESPRLAEQPVSSKADPDPSAGCFMDGAEEEMLEIRHAQRLHIEWCRELLELTGLTTTNQTEPQMRAVMHELRASVDPEAAVAISCALPPLERGIFLDGWTLDHTPDPPPDPQAFHNRVYERVRRHHSPPDSLASDVFSLWRRRLSVSRANMIRDNLPQSLRSLWA